MELIYACTSANTHTPHCKHTRPTGTPLAASRACLLIKLYPTHCVSVCAMTMVIPLESTTEYWCTHECSAPTPRNVTGPPATPSTVTPRVEFTFMEPPPTIAGKQAGVGKQAVARRQE